MPNLYEINEALTSLLASIEAVGGELTDVTEAQWEELNLQRDKKIAAIAAIITQEEARGEAIDREVDRLRDLKGMSINKIDWLSRYLTAVIGEGNKYDGGTFKIGWRKGTSVVIEPLNSEIPAIYMRVIPEKHEPDKKALKEALQTGVTIPGVTLKTEQHIQIK